jgi:hypothetical protein
MNYLLFFFLFVCFCHLEMCLPSPIIWYASHISRSRNRKKVERRRLTEQQVDRMFDQYGKIPGIDALYATLSQSARTVAVLRAKNSTLVAYALIPDEINLNPLTNENFTTNSANQLNKLSLRSKFRRPLGLCKVILPLNSQNTTFICSTGFQSDCKRINTIAKEVLVNVTSQFGESSGFEAKSNLSFLARHISKCLIDNLFNGMRRAYVAHVFLISSHTLTKGIVEIRPTGEVNEVFGAVAGKDDVVLRNKLVAAINQTLHSNETGRQSMFDLTVEQCKTILSQIFDERNMELQREVLAEEAVDGIVSPSRLFNYHIEVIPDVDLDHPAYQHL